MIEDIILRHNKRGMHLLKGAMQEDFCLRAAQRLLSCPPGNVFLFTGFYCGGAAETDGPPGTYFLARALQRLGYLPILVAESLFRPLFEYGSPVNGLYFNWGEAIDYNGVLDRFQPVCLISIERCGRALDQKYYNMYGEDISGHTLPMDDFFVLAKPDIPRIAIGDGGNEMGMGRFHDKILKELRITPSVTEADELIVSTVSNWGAYGLIAYLEMLTQLSVMPEYPEVQDYLQHLCHLGVVDGATGVPGMSVDGYGPSFEAEILDSLMMVLHPQAAVL